MAYGDKIREEELKNKVGRDFFSAFDWTQILGGIDFAVAPPSGRTRELWDDVEFFLWAEAKSGTKKKISDSFVQLIFTIGKEHTHEKLLPPAFLGAFDAEKIAFVPYLSVAGIFSQTDFNWNVAPSNHETKEFKQLAGLVTEILKDETLQFYFGKDDRDLRDFIKKNFREGVKEPGKIQITKNNFISIYQKWHIAVAPHIAIDWKETKKAGLLDADFYLADLLSRENFTLKEKLRVLLQSDYYKLVQGRNDFGFLEYSDVHFKDKARAHRNFWKCYVRPPREEFWEFIIERRDLLVPQDIRERKGSYYTPQIWVEKSQEYLADVLGENWQDDFVIWDCCAGTGNLLNGLVNNYKIFASTLDPADVQIMKDRAANGANLLEKNIFQFDFLNDPIEKLPVKLRKIVQDEEARKNLIIYINPPYAEATSHAAAGRYKPGVAKGNIIEKKANEEIGNASNELFVQFLFRIYDEFYGVWLGNFGTLKILQGENFERFRNFFRARLEKMFVVPAATFDNVKGAFPVGFFIWNTKKEEKFKTIQSDVFDENGNKLPKKKFHAPHKTSLNRWLKQFKCDDSAKSIGIFPNYPTVFQTQEYVCILSKPNARFSLKFTRENLVPFCIYFAVRRCIPKTWLNNQDSMFFPNDSLQNDLEFHSDCLAFALFHGQNRISSSEGENHWIPFTEAEVGAKEPFSSHFMSDFLRGKLKKDKMVGDFFLSNQFYDGTTSVKFSDEAHDVFNAGKELWKYYHSQYGAAADASLLDIRRHFQGMSDKGRMNSKSDDECYTELMMELRNRLKILAEKIEPKVYEHGFLHQ